MNDKVPEPNDYSSGNWPLMRLLLAIIRSVAPPSILIRVILPVVADLDLEIAESSFKGSASSDLIIRLRAYRTILAALIALLMDSTIQVLLRVVNWLRSPSFHKAQPQHQTLGAFLPDNQMVNSAKLTVTLCLIMSLGFVLHLILASQRLAAPSAPSSRVAIVAVLPTDIQFRGGETVASTSVPDWADSVVLLLSQSRFERFASYQIDFHAAEDIHHSPLWRLEDVRPTDYGTFAIQVQRSFLVEPKRVSLYGLDGATRTLLAEYAVGGP